MAAMRRLPMHFIPDSAAGESSGFVAIPGQTRRVPDAVGRQRKNWADCLN